MLTAIEINDLWNQSRNPDDFARAIERAVLAKAGEQESVAFIAPNGDIRKSCEANNADEWGAEFTPLYTHPMPAQAISDKQYIIDPRNDDGEYYLLGSDINALLSASPKP